MRHVAENIGEKMIYLFFSKFTRPFLKDFFQKDQKFSRARYLEDMFIFEKTIGFPTQPFKRRAHFFIICVI